MSTVAGNGSAFSYKPHEHAMNREYRGSDTTHLPRAASFTNLPTTIEDSEQGIKRTFSDNDLVSLEGGSPKNSVPRLPAHVSGTAGSVSSDPTKKRSFGLSRTTSKITLTKFTVKSDNLPENTAYDRKKIETDRKGRTVTGSLAKFARKSFLSSSRSPSPNNRAMKNGIKYVEDDDDKRSITMKRLNTAPAIAEVPGDTAEVSPPPSPPKTLQRTGTSLKRRISVRPLSSFIPKSVSETNLSLRKSPSMSSLRSAIERNQSLDEIVPPVPPPSNSALRVNQLHAAPKKKDELWTAFRMLEGDFQKYV